MRPYHQLTQIQRYQIYVLRKTGHSQTEIAAAIGVHKATISREVRRNRGGRNYRPRQADLFATARKRKGRARIQAHTWSLVERLLRKDWSPEQISARLKAEQAVQISHEWIYQHVLADKRTGGALFRHLRCQKTQRKRYGSYQRRGKLLHCRSIEERPKVVESRKRLGDWEVDTVVGGKQKAALLTLTDRKSRFTVVGKTSNRTAPVVRRKLVQLLQPYADQAQTLTSDHGKEFAQHEQIAQALQLQYFFAHPYAAWERGTNENTNGLLRQYFPRQRDFNSITARELVRAMTHLNRRPRKCLGFKTPYEVFFGVSIALAG
jgi:IS30 family transposase